MGNDLRIIRLREYLFDIIKKLNNEYKQVNINFLSDEIDNYSLDRIPVESEVHSWITGDIVYKDVYSFRSRMNYSADVMSNIENIGFYELFEQIIKKNNESNNLPNIKGIESIKCLNCGTMNNAQTHTAEFDIQIQIEYRQDVDNIIVSL